MVVLRTKWTKISFKEHVRLYYVGSSDDIISFCWGAWSSLVSTLVLQYWVKLLHAWIVSILSCTVPILSKIFYFFYCPSVYICLRNLVVALSLVCLLLLSFDAYFYCLFSICGCFCFVSMVEWLCPF